MFCFRVMAKKRQQNVILDNCMFPYICSFLNATDLIRSRSVCSSWQDLFQYAIYWIQVSCVPSSHLTQMLSKMKELIHCDIVVLSESETWDLIIHPHQKLIFLKIRHSAKKTWDGGNCKIGPLPKLHTLEIHDAEEFLDSFSSKFDSFVLETPQLDTLSVSNFIIPDHCIPCSISKLSIRTKCLRVIHFNLLRFNLEHCSRLLYLCCESLIFQSQTFIICSKTVQFVYYDSFYNFAFICPNLKCLCTSKWLHCERYLGTLAQKYPKLQKLFAISDFSQTSFDSFHMNMEKLGINVATIATLKQFETIVDNELNQLKLDN